MLHYIMDNSLQDYINEINFTSFPKDDIVGFFDKINKFLYINFENAIKHSNYKEIFNKYKSELVTFEYDYFFILFCIYHELGHVKQLKEENDVSHYGELKDIIEAEYKLSQDNYKLYNQNHDLFAMEHDANVNGMVNAINFNKEYQNHYLVSYKNIKQYLLFDYDINNGVVLSPLDKLVNITGDYKLIKNNYICKYPLGVRACFGLPINRDEYTRINDMDDNEIKELVKERN